MRVTGYTALALLLIGCPQSDDIVQISDTGLTRLDVVLEGDVPPPPDVPVIPTDDGDEPPDETTPEGCQADEDCDEELDLQLCQVGVCDLVNGTCSLGAAPDGATCDNDNACDITECNTGACVAVSVLDCDDGNDCTADVCNPSVGCQNIDKTAPCDDGDPCTVDDSCSGGICLGGKNFCGVGTQDDPGTNCQKIQELVPAATDGVYYLNDGKGGVVEVFCLMESEGGAWLRVVSVGGEVPICGYAAGFGTPAQVAAGSVTTSALPAATVSGLSLGEDEVLLVLDTGMTYHYMSTHDGFGWPAIADGTINRWNVADYGLEVSIDGAATEAVSQDANTNFPGPPLLGGVPSVSGGYTPLLGIGGHHAGSFIQDANCTTVSAGKNGLWTKSGWGKKGMIYIR